MHLLLRMQNFFNNQYDYIYFFYGLSFLFMAAICYLLGREKPKVASWLFMASFCLIHGIHEWAELAVIYCGDSRHFAIMRLAILIASYIALMEFARRGLSRVWKIAYAVFIYIPFIALMWYLRRSDIATVNIAVRYFLGLPAGLLSALTIYGMSRSEKKSGMPLLFLCAMMALYAMMTGMIVTKTTIWPSMWINSEAFKLIFGVPIQLARGVIVLLAATAVWFYSQGLPQENIELIKYHIHFKPSKWMIAVTMVLLISLGWALTNYLDYYGSNQIIKSSKADRDSPINILNRELTKLELAVILMSTSSRIIYVLTLPAPRFIERSRRMLEGYRKDYSAIDCFLTDVNGVIISSASGAPSEAAGGKTCRDTLYFKEAISGGIGHHFAQGTTNDERIYYVSAPIKKTGEEIFGTVVIKKMISVKPILQYRLISIFITFFISIITIALFMVVKRRERIIAFAEEANRQLSSIDMMKNHFISVVSHELRTPLTAIKNAASLMAKGWPDRQPVDERQKELVDVIVNNTNRQIRMISDLLDISKIEAGVIIAHPEPVDLTALIDDVLSSFRPQIEEKSITVHEEFDETPGIAFADPEHIRRIIANLTHNAIKFTHAEGVITLILKKSDSEITVTVSDTGVGIDSSELGKLFNKFYRTNYATSHKDGSGLGLAISKGLIEVNGGRIWAESEAGKGCAFHFTVPIFTKKEAENS